MNGEKQKMEENKCRICGEELKSYDEGKRGICSRCFYVVELLGRPELSPDLLEIWISRQKKSKKRQSGVICAICGKVIPCDKKEIPENCAKKHRLYHIKTTDLADGSEENMYVCRSCCENILKVILSKIEGHQIWK